MIVVDECNRDTIPKSIHPVAGRTGQEYNERKKRKGPFWEDRYHATAIETGEHLLKCLTVRDSKWTRSVAVGGEQFVRRIKGALGARALGRKIWEATGGFELRERLDSYNADFASENGHIDLNYTYIWNLYA